MIASTSNRQVRRVVNLRTKAKARREEGLYVAEGLRICQECDPAQTEQLYVTETFAALEEHRAFLSRFHWEIVTDAVMNAMADTKTPQGVLALLRQRTWKREDILGKSGKPLVMILENLQDPGNLGTIIRAGEGAGVTGILMSRDTVDLYNPKVIRSTMGSVFRMPFVYSSSLAEDCLWLKEKGVRLFAAHLNGMNNYDQEAYTDGTGFLIGNEANGLTEEASALADCRIKIPMAGSVESLNAAVAASVLMFEAARQRRL